MRLQLLRAYHTAMAWRSALNVVSIHISPDVALWLHGQCVIPSTPGPRNTFMGVNIVEEPDWPDGQITVRAERIIL